MISADTSHVEWNGSLGIYTKYEGQDKPAWSFVFGTCYYSLQYPLFLQAENDGSEQTARTRKLICVFTVRICDKFSHGVALCFVIFITIPNGKFLLITSYLSFKTSSVRVIVWAYSFTSMGCHRDFLLCQFFLRQIYSKITNELSWGNLS